MFSRTARQKTSLSRKAETGSAERRFQTNDVVAITHGCDIVVADTDEKSRDPADELKLDITRRILYIQMVSCLQHPACKRLRLASQQGESTRVINHDERFAHLEGLYIHILVTLSEGT